MNAAVGQWLPVIYPRAILNANSWTTVEIDTLGAAYLEVAVLLGATDIALTALKLGESDTTGGGGSYTDITGAVFGTSTNSAGSTSSLPSATDDNKIFLFNIDLKGRKRFLSLTATIDSGSTGGFLAAMARLTRLETSPSTAARYGASQVLRVPAYGS
jgi:hypothetical protein